MTHHNLPSRELEAAKHVLSSAGRGRPHIGVHGVRFYRAFGDRSLHLRRRRAMWDAQLRAVAPYHVAVASATVVPGNERAVFRKRRHEDEASGGGRKTLSSRHARRGRKSRRLMSTVVKPECKLLFGRFCNSTVLLTRHHETLPGG